MLEVFQGALNLVHMMQRDASLLYAIDILVLVNHLIISISSHLVHLICYSVN